MWSPNKSSEVRQFQNNTIEKRTSPLKEVKNDEPVPVVWTPRSAGSSPTVEKKEFKTVNFESPTFSRKNLSKVS